MRDKYGSGADPDCYPDTDVLINLLNIRDEALLTEAEREFSLLAADSLDFLPPPYDLRRLRDIHRALFGDVYAWAGEIRQRDISKGQTRFCHVGRIVPEADKLFRRLADRDYLCAMPIVVLAREAAYFYNELNVIHPFRDGNGRALRILFEHLVVNTGHALRWEGVGREQWLEANIQGYLGNLTPLIQIFETCIGPFPQVS